MLSCLCWVEMDDDGKNSQTHLLGDELWVPQHICVIRSQHHVSHIRGGHRDLSQGPVTGQCLPDTQKIQSHVATLGRL